MIARCRDPRWLVLALLWLTASSVVACKIPVFRYALERWSADRYRIVAVIDGTPNGPIDAAFAELESIRGSSANIDVETIDLSKLSEEQLWQVEGLGDEAKTPQLQVFFPERDGRRQLCWSGDLTPEAVRQWRDSPLRRQIVKDITTGISAVWILVEGSDADENERMANQLQSALTTAAATISIPEGVISGDEASNYLNEHPEGSLDDVLRSDIPLKIDFVARRLEFDNDDELALRAIISGWNGQSEIDSNHALVFPVFGRGRMIEPLAAEHFSEDSVIAACRYMVGECSCTMKSLNPGVDLVLDTNWREWMDESLVIVDHAPPTTPVPVAIPAGRGGPTNTAAEEPVTQNRTLTILAVGLFALIAVGLWRTVIGRRQ